MGNSSILEGSISALDGPTFSTISTPVPESNIDVLSKDVPCLSAVACSNYVFLRSSTSITTSNVDDSASYIAPRFPNVGCSNNGS